MSQARSAVAAIATLLAGVVIGGVGFLRYVQHAASANNDAMLAIAARQAEGTLGGQEIPSTAPVALTMLASLTFAVATPLGWLATYLTLTGLVRSLEAAVGEQRGDPLIAGARKLFHRTKARRRARAAAAELARRAGPEIADRLVDASRLGVPDADLVIVASRPKPEWSPGTILDCGERWLTVGGAIERTLPQGLRTLYPLVETRELEVFRRVIPYDLPRKVE